MIKFEYTEVVGWEPAIRGMRNPMNSWSKSDSEVKFESWHNTTGGDFNIGPNDHNLMINLRNAGTDHRKFMRMIAVYVDITAPLYWWKEFDTYKVGTVVNSCSTMHKIHSKEFTMDDFSTEHLLPYPSEEVFKSIIKALNTARTCYLECETPITKKDWWWNMIQLLPSSYNQKRTVMMNYEVLANIYKSRKNHKLDEWSIGFIQWIESLPYSELITGESDE